MTTIDHKTPTREFCELLLHGCTNADAYQLTGITHRDDLDTWQAQIIFDAAETVARRGRDQGHPDAQIAIEDVYHELRDQGHLEQEPMRQYWLSIAAPPTVPPVGRHRLRTIASRLAEDSFRRRLAGVDYSEIADTAPLSDLADMFARDVNALRERYARAHRQPDLTVINSNQKKGA